MKNYIKIVFFIAFFNFNFGTAQEEIIGEESKYESNSLFERDSSIDVTSNYKKREKFTLKKKKIKKNVFYGIKTKRAYTRNGSGNRVTIELFFVLKKPIDPDKNAQEVYWYDLRTQKISTKPLNEKSKPYALILHGPYKRTLNGQILEEGQFYVGTKHGRWETLDKSNTLVDKVKYYKGWPKDSKFDYWDPETKKELKEVIPIVNGFEHGRYLKFYKSGEIEIDGKFVDGVKSGVWTEYYDSKGQKKIEYEFHPDSANPEILKKWSSKGKETYNKYPDRDLNSKKKKNSTTKVMKKAVPNSAATKEEMEETENIKPSETDVE